MYLDFDSKETLIRKHRTIEGIVRDYFYLTEEIVKKSPYKIGDKVALVRDLGPFDIKESPGFVGYEALMSKGNIGVIKHIDIIIPKNTEILCDLWYHVEMPFAYYDGKHHYGTHIPNEEKRSANKEFITFGTKVFGFTKNDLMKSEVIEMARLHP